MAKILVIDDVPDVRMTIDVALSSGNHEIIEAGSGCEGLKKLKENCFDVIITDLMMPDINGSEIIRAARALCRSPYIITISGGGNKISTDESLRTAHEHAHFMLRKPFTCKELQDAVNSLLSEGN